MQFIYLIWNSTVITHAAYLETVKLIVKNTRLYKVNTASVFQPNHILDLGIYTY